MEMTLDEAVKEFNAKPLDSTDETLEHINKVRGYLIMAATELLRRARVHDASKLGPEEKPYFDQAQALKEIEYGSEEYKVSLAKLKPALDHHYANNSHHPEFYGDLGINGMDLFDILEMLFDWKAAGERTKDGNILKSLTVGVTRFKINPQLEQILYNTVARCWGEGRTTIGVTDAQD